METVLIIALVSAIGTLAWALLGERRESRERSAETSPVDDSDQVMRRRAADREIEESFPEPEGAPSGRERAPDAPAPVSQDETREAKRHQPEEGEISDRDMPPPEELELPYPAASILPEHSRFNLYRRTLLNAEIYAKRGELGTAISLFQGVFDRIQDEEIRHRIDADIEYLKKLQEARSEAHQKKEQEALSSAGSPAKSEEVHLKVDGQLPSSITIGVSGEMDSESVISKISDILKEQMQSFRGELENFRQDIDQSGRSSQEVTALKTELAELRHRMSRMMETTRNDDLENLRKNLGEITDLKDELNRLNRNMMQSAIPQTEKPPAPVEARFQSPLPVTLDPKPILEMLDRLPPAQKESPSAEKETPPAEAPPLPPEESRKEPTERTEEPAVKKDEQVTRREEEGEEKEDFEVLADRDREPDDGLSDEDIFERILREDKKEKDDSFEILDGRDREEPDELDIAGDDLGHEDQDFYRKLIKSSRKMKRELPVLKVSYDFSRLPEAVSLSREKNLITHSFYKFKPMLEKANDLIRKRKVRDAINYYEVVLQQNIPPEFKSMVRKNIRDLHEYLEKYLTGE